jgi:hypothetical protein
MDITFHYPPELLNLLNETLPKLCKSKKDVLLFFQGAGIGKELLAPYESLLRNNKNDFNKYPVTREMLAKLNELGERSLRERREILKRVLSNLQTKIVGQLRRNQFGGLRLLVHLMPAKLDDHFKLFAAGVFTPKQQRTIPAGGHRLDELCRCESKHIHNQILASNLHITAGTRNSPDSSVASSTMDSVKAIIRYQDAV